MKTAIAFMVNERIVRVMAKCNLPAPERVRCRKRGQFGLCVEITSNEVSAIFDAYASGEIAPVVHGRWIPHTIYADDCSDIIGLIGYKCSVCGRFESEEEPFCNCGAMMDLEDEQ